MDAIAIKRSNRQDCMMFEIIDMPPIFYTQVGFAFDVIFMLGKFEIAGDTYQMIVFDVRSFKMEWAGL